MKMRGDYELDSEIDIREKCWKEAIIGKMNTLKTDLAKKDEELFLYKQRLKEIENAFCYNLNLLSDRDLELDALENQLHFKVEEIQRLILQHREEEEAVRKLDQERLQEMKLFQSQLLLKEQEICELERKNKANVNTLKHTLEDVKHEYDEKISKLLWTFDNQKKEIENHFKTIADVNTQKYLRDINDLIKQNQIHLDNINREKENLILLQTENNQLKQQIAKAEIEFKGKENLLLQEIEQINKRFKKVNRELQDINSKKKIEKQVGHKETQIRPDTNSIGTDIDFEELKNENSRGSNQLSKNEMHNMETPCHNCTGFMSEIKENSNKLQIEIIELKKILREERNQRMEEELIIQNLETSVYSLKEKLLSELQRKFVDENENSTEEETINCVNNRDIQNQIRLTLLEHQFDKKLNALISSTKEERRLLFTRMEEMEKECLSKLEKCFKNTESSSREMNTEDFVLKIRQEINKLEDKIENNFRINTEKRGKCDKSLQVAFENNENPYKMKTVSDSVFITPDNKYWIFPNRNNLPKEKHIIVQSQIQKCYNSKIAGNSMSSRPGKIVNKTASQIQPKSRFFV